MVWLQAGPLTGQQQQQRRGAIADAATSPLPASALAPSGVRQQQQAGDAAAADLGESVGWVNMCWRKMWRVDQRGLER